MTFHYRLTQDLCKYHSKWLKFVYTNKWYIYKSEHVLENGTHKILWDFEMQTNNTIQTRKPDLLVFKKKRTWKSVDHRAKEESKQQDKYIDLARDLKSCGT